MNAAGLTTVQRFIASLSCGDFASAQECLSPAFMLHRGRDAADFIRYEMTEFQCRAAGSVEVQVFGTIGNAILYAVKSESGLLYDDCLPVDEAGRILGDGSRFEIVSKLSFRQNKVMRALAVRPPESDRLIVVPLGGHSFDVSCSRAMDSDGFHQVLFELPEDNLRTCSQRLYFVSGNTRERREVILRGLDRPGFKNNLFPKLDGRNVILKDPGWCLSVCLSDGTISVIDNPSAGRHAFSKPVVCSVLTDKLDNDWIMEL